MKFLVSKDIHANKNFTLLLGFYALMLLFYFLGDLVYLGNFFGYTAQSIHFTLRGDPDSFIEPLTLLAFLEHLHVSLFLALISLFTTMAIVLRLQLTNAHKKRVILSGMLSLFFGYASLLIAYFFGSFFTYSFIVFSIFWHLTGVYALFMILLEIGKRR